MKYYIPVVFYIYVLEYLANLASKIKLTRINSNFV